MAGIPSRKLLLGAAFGGAALALGGCATTDRDFGARPARNLGALDTLFPVSPPDAVTALPLPPLSAPLDTAGLPAGTSRVVYAGYETPGTILVDIRRHRLYLVQGNGTALSYPIAAPRNGADIPPADNVVTAKKINPTWTPTENMRRRNPALPAQIAGGRPDNPLGIRALYLGSTLFRIHGTNEPQSIGTDASSGCIRMHNAHVADLYDRVPVGSVVRVYRGGPVPGVDRAVAAMPRAGLY